MALAAKVAHQLQRRRALAHFTNHGLDAGGTVFVDKFIDVPIGHCRAADFIPGAIRFFPGTHIAAVLFPEIGGQFAGAGVQHIGVFDSLVAVIIFGVHTDHGGLDAQVDVFRDQYHPNLR